MNSLSAGSVDSTILKNNNNIGDIEFNNFRIFDEYLNKLFENLPIGILITDKKNKAWKNTPIIFLSAKTDNFSKSFGKILAEAFIQKPFNLIELKKKADKILGHPFDIPKTKEKIIDDIIRRVFENK